MMDDRRQNRGFGADDGRGRRGRTGSTGRRGPEHPGAQGGRARRLAALGLALAGLLAAGCSERVQFAQPHEAGKYQGKPDGKPWDNRPTAAGASRWQAGDKGSWESALRARQQAQNEYVRTR